MRTMSKWGRMIPLAAWIVIIGAVGAVVMLLWNWLIPGIFGLTAITYWQALGLFALARILFGSFGHRPMMHDRGMRGAMAHGKMGSDCGNPMHEKWMKMTPEERKAFIKERKAHFGHHHHPFGHSGFGREELFKDEEKENQ